MDYDSSQAIGVAFPTSLNRRESQPMTDTTDPMLGSANPERSWRHHAETLGGYARSGQTPLAFLIGAGCSLTSGCPSLKRVEDILTAMPAQQRGDLSTEYRFIPFTRRYRVTDDGLRTALCYHRTYARVLRPAMCYHRTYARVLRPAMSVVFDAPPRSASRLNRAVDSFDSEIQRLWKGRQLAA